MPVTSPNRFWSSLNKILSESTNDIVANLKLIKAGYPPINVKFSDRHRYYQAFDDYARSGSPNTMTVLIAEYLEQRLQSMIKSLSGARIIDMGSTRTCQLYVIPREPSIMHPEGDFYVLKMDVELLVAFPSVAASFCTGTAMQGTTAWVDAEDKTFSSVFK